MATVTKQQQVYVYDVSGRRQEKCQVLHIYGASITRESRRAGGCGSSALAYSQKQNPEGFEKPDGRDGQIGGLSGL